MCNPVRLINLLLSKSVVTLCFHLSCHTQEDDAQRPTREGLVMDLPRNMLDKTDWLCMASVIYDFGSLSKNAVEI